MHFKIKKTLFSSTRDINFFTFDLPLQRTLDSDHQTTIRMYSLDVQLNYYFQQMTPGAGVLMRSDEPAKKDLEGKK